MTIKIYRETGIDKSIFITNIHTHTVIAVCRYKYALPAIIHRIAVRT